MLQGNGSLIFYDTTHFNKIQEINVPDAVSQAL